MLVIGLTGGIGTGKSEVSGILSTLGAAVINADLVGHEVYRPQTEGWHRIIDAFGKDVLGPTGAIDRRKLGAIVFSDAEALERLNAIAHPRIYAKIEERIAELRGEGSTVAVVEAALLIEAGWTPLVDEVWVVVSDERNVIDRLRNRHLDHASIRARIDAQMTQSERAKRGDVVIDNDGTLAELTQSVEQLWASRVARHKENTTQR